MLLMRCGHVDSETAQAIVTVAGVSQKGQPLGAMGCFRPFDPQPGGKRGLRPLKALTNAMMDS
jgi:hypothetical protein